MIREASAAVRPCQQLPALPLALLMRQLAALVEDLTDAQYRAKPVGVIESSIGSHVRHCLDHVAALLGAIETELLNYDDRRRGTDVEADRFAALQLMRNLESRLAQIGSADLDRPILLSATLAVGQQATGVYTTLGREIAYVVSHTIHHNALIAAMVKTLGGAIPARFGYAPSTVAHMEKQLLSCAPSA